MLAKYVTQQATGGSLSTESATIPFKHARKFFTQMKNAASIPKYIDFAYYKAEHMALLTAPRHKLHVKLSTCLPTSSE